MTEEEKIFAGKMFDPRSEELRQIKHKAHEAAAATIHWTNMTRNARS